jgi:hypothetical protein
MTATPRLRVLRIFGRYQEYGGEEAAARRIHETLKPYPDAEWLESSTDALLGKSILCAGVSSSLGVVEIPGLPLGAFHRVRSRSLS